MATFHLTKLENAGNDYRIRRGSTFKLIVYVQQVEAMVGRAVTFRACIKKKLKDDWALAVFAISVGALLPEDHPTYPSHYPVILSLTAQQTLAMPATVERASSKDKEIGRNVYLWDLLMQLDDDPDLDFRIFDPSYVEVVDGVTPTVDIQEGP